MSLLQNIRSERSRHRKKQPFVRDTFNQIHGLVRRYGLEERFLTVLENEGDYLSETNLEGRRIREKVPFESPLFSLATAEEYRLATAILSKVDNPYLQFAHSPEEILLSRPLYHLNPALNSEILKCCHFETLLMYEHAKGLVSKLAGQTSAGREKAPANGEDDRNEAKRLQLVALQERITKLQNHIVKSQKKQSD